MSDLNVDISQLPQDVRDKLAELDLELSEGKRGLAVLAGSCLHCAVTVWLQGLISVCMAVSGGVLGL